MIFKMEFKSAVEVGCIKEGMQGVTVVIVKASFTKMVGSDRDVDS